MPRTPAHPTLLATVEKLLEELDGGDCRFWVHDSVSLDGVLSWDVGGQLPAGEKPAKVKGYVGLVDEREGGMVAYGPYELIEPLSELLNKADAMERIAKAAN